MKSQPTTYLRRRRKVLAKRLLSLTPEIIRGSLIETYKRCGRKECQCAQGTRHGPKYYLSVSHPGKRPEMSYVPQNYKGQVEQFIANFQEVRKFLEQISNINREILQRRERF